MVVPSSSTDTPRRPLRKIFTLLLVSAVCGVLVAGLMLPLASLVGLTTRNVAQGFESLPLELDTEPTPQRTTVLDRDGNVLAYFYRQNRQDVPLDQVSPIMQKAIIAIEDSRYYEHGALDVRGTIRAFISNAADNATQGGSSITQQLVKQILVTKAKTKAEREAAVETTYARKLRELQYALAYERRYSKQQILESYLNIAYFGAGAYGVQEAAQRFFSVDAQDLNLQQSALIAGLVKNPAAYDPTRFPNEAQDRRNTVLARMATLGIITDRRAERLYGSGLDLKGNPRANGCVSTKAPFFCLYVQNYLLRQPALGDTPAERQQMLNEGGLTIQTTLDLEFQRAADAAIRQRVYPQDPAVGAMAMVRPGNGEVRAIAQSRPVGTNKNQGETYLNYAVPERYGNANGFQPGSTMKLFVVAAALEMGLPPSISFRTEEPYQLPSGTTYKTCDGDYWIGDQDVENSTGDNGVYDLARGTQQSINVFFMKLEQVTGMCRPAELAREMGLKIAAEYEVPSFALGVADASPVDIAGAYATFAARGMFCEPHPVTEVRDREGNVLATYTGDCKRLLKKATADAINQILEGVQSDFGFGAANQLSIPSAAKTGTTQNGVAVWYAGYAKSLATATVLAGVDQDGKPETLYKKIIGGQYTETVSGSGIAGPMWAAAMRAIEDRLPKRGFPDPDLADLGGAAVSIPGTSGMSITAAQTLLERAGFTTIIGDYVDSGYAAGTVAYTTPFAYSNGYKGQVITIHPSTGNVIPPPVVEPPPTLELPPVEGPGDGGDAGGDGNDDGGDGFGGFGGGGNGG